MWKRKGLGKGGMQGGILGRSLIAAIVWRVCPQIEESHARIASHDCLASLPTPHALCPPCLCACSFASTSTTPHAPRAPPLQQTLSPHPTLRREDGQDITFEEYNELLSALTDASVFADKHGDGDLVQARAELPNMAGALKRRRDDEYHNLLPGSAHKDLERINARRARSRAEWERQLTQILDAQARAGAGGADMGTQLAEHCVRESRGHAITMAAGLLAVAVQLASAYVALSLSMRLPLKGD